MKINSKQVRLLLTAGSIVGLYVTAVCAAHDGMRARYEMNNGDLWEADTKTKIKELGKCFIKTGISTAVTTGCIVASHKVSGKQIATVAGLAAGTQQLYKRYEDKLKEVFPKEKLEEVKREVIKERAIDKKKQLDRNSRLKDKLKHMEGDELFYEPITDQFFYSTREKILEAQNGLNWELIHKPDDIPFDPPYNPGCGVEFNKWLRLINCPKTEIDYKLFGWYYNDGDGYWDYNWELFGGPWISINFIEIDQNDDRYNLIDEPFTLLDYGPMPPYFANETEEVNSQYVKELNDAKDRWANENA